MKKHPGEMTVYEMLEAIQEFYGLTKKEAKREFETMTSDERLEAYIWWCNK